MSARPDSQAHPDDPLCGNLPADILGCAMLADARETGLAGWKPPAPAHVAELLPKFDVESMIGRGAMGAVYRGHQVSLDRPVAIKLLPSELSDDPEFAALFRREARTLAALHHPGIVTIHDFGETSEHHLFIVMELVEGTTLDRLMAGGPLDPARAVSLAASICAALEYAHSRGIVHRDVKPSNILIDTSGNPKLADFGLARPLSPAGSDSFAAHPIAGTPEYMAPEQQRGSCDHRADLFAVGVILYEMLTGIRPSGAFDPPSSLVGVDQAMDRVVDKAMSHEPSRRYQDAGELIEDLAGIAGSRRPAGSSRGYSPPASPLTPPRIATPSMGCEAPNRNRSWRTITLLLGAAMIAATGWLLTLEWQRSKREIGIQPNPSAAPTVPASTSQDGAAGSPAPSPEASDPEIARFRAELMQDHWRYTHKGFPESIVRFHPHGRFHDRWHWQYWVKDRRTLEVQFNQNPRNPAEIVIFRFNEEMTEFDSTFRGADGRTHHVQGFRKDPVK